MTCMRTCINGNDEQSDFYPSANSALAGANKPWTTYIEVSSSLGRSSPFCEGLVYLHDGLKDAFNDDCTTISEKSPPVSQLCLCPLDRFRQVPIVNGKSSTSVLPANRRLAIRTVVMNCIMSQRMKRDDCMWTFIPRKFPQIRF